MRSIQIPQEFNLIQNHFLQVFSLAAVLSLIVDMVIKKEEA